jgi:hypothetical protein
VHTKLASFVTFWVGSTLCLVYLATMLVAGGMIHWGEQSVTTIAWGCFILILYDLMLLLEYISAPREKDDEERR